MVKLTCRFLLAFCEKAVKSQLGHKHLYYMKIIAKSVVTAIASAFFLSTTAFGQPMGSTPPDESAKPKPIQPVLARHHSGPGRIGVRLIFLKDSGLPQIAAMTRGGPAADYGFCIGDVIIKIDKNYTNSLTQEEVKLALHGEPGTGVELTVQRGDDPKLIVKAIERRILTADAEDIPTAVVMEAKP
jgi:S1-C subfamily serine protease